LFIFVGAAVPCQSLNPFLLSSISKAETEASPSKENHRNASSISGTQTGVVSFSLKISSERRYGTFLSIQ
jgi:hypothetical protein